MRGWTWLTVLNREVRKAFLRWWTLRFQRSEEVSTMDSQGKSVPGRGVPAPRGEDIPGM